MKFKSELAQEAYEEIMHKFRSSATMTTYEVLN
jgi:hypothetical protein